MEAVAKIRRYIYRNKLWLKRKIRQLNLITPSLSLRYNITKKKVTSSYNTRAISILLVIFVLLGILQYYILQRIVAPPNINEKNKIKKLLKKEISAHLKTKEEVNNTLTYYILKCNSFARKISVPFHLNWISYLQYNLPSWVKEEKGITGYYLFNHFGRLLVMFPEIKKFRYIVYTFTPYMKYILNTIKEQEYIVYFFVDNPEFKKIYNKSEKFIDLKKNYIGYPFYLGYDKIDKTPVNLKQIFDIKFHKKSIPPVMFFVPLFNQAGKFIGTACLTVNPEFIFTLPDKNNISSVIINKHGFIVYSKEFTYIGRRLSRVNFLDSKDRIIIFSRNEIYIKSPLSVNRWILLSKVKDTSFLFKRTLPQDFYLKYGILLTMEFIIFFLLFILFRKNVVKTINRISDNIKRLALGIPETRKSGSSINEIKVIENRLTYLTNRIADYLIFGKRMTKSITKEAIDRGFYLSKTPASSSGSVLYMEIKNFDILKREYGNNKINELVAKFYNDIEMFASKNNGYIEYFTANSFLIIFGIPFGSHHPLEALKTADLIFKEIKLFNRINKVNFRISISLNTGELFFSRIPGNKGRYFVVLGDTIKHTILYNSIVKPDVIVISEDTYNQALTKPKYDHIIYIKKREEKRKVKLFLKKIK